MTNVAKKLLKTSNKGAENFLHRVMKVGSESLSYETNFNDWLHGETQKLGLEKINNREVNNVCCRLSYFFFELRPP